MCTFFIIGCYTNYDSISITFILIQDEADVDSTGATDQFGIPGYDKVDFLAQELLGLTGFLIDNNNYNKQVCSQFHKAI